MYNETLPNRQVHWFVKFGHRVKKYAFTLHIIVFAGRVLNLWFTTHCFYKNEKKAIKVWKYSHSIVIWNRLESLMCWRIKQYKRCKWTPSWKLRWEILVFSFSYIDNFQRRTINQNTFPLLWTGKWETEDYSLVVLILSTQRHITVPAMFWLSLTLSLVVFWCHSAKGKLSY